MRRLFTYFAVMVAMVATLVGCTEDTKEKKAAAGEASAALSYERVVPNDAAVVARLDANQVLVKSGLKAELTQMIRERLQAEGAPKMVLGFVDDFRNTGIDVEAPVYAFAKIVAKDNIFVGLVAKTYHKDLLDKFLNLAFSGALNKVELSGCSVVQIEQNLALAYNNTAVVYGGIFPIEDNYDSYGSFNINVNSYLVDVLQNATNGNGGAVLPAYKGSDAAICLNMKSLVDVVKQQILKEMDGGYNSEVAYALDMLEQSRNGKLDLALNFADGSINLDFMASNFAKPVDFELQPCSNKNLDKVSANALAVVNVPFNGPEFVRVFTELLEKNPNYKNMICTMIENEGVDSSVVDVILNVALPMLSSVDGDLTFALNSVKPTHNDYAMTADIDACAVVNVTNSSIINAVDMMGLANDPMVTNLGNSNYSINADGVNIYFGQKGDLLYASTPDIVAPKHPAATSASWYPAVQGSYAYALVNISSLLQIPEFKQGVIEGAQESGASIYSVMQLVESLDYLLLTAPTPESVSLRLVFKNKNENALKQVVNVAKHEIYNAL